MEYRKLGRTDLDVSTLCLGTMTWGEQNDQAEAFAQIAMAKARGINFIDTAEMYPVPPRPETCAATERIIGNWFRQQGDRDDWVLASKVAGPGNGISISATASSSTTVRTSSPPWTRASSACTPTTSTCTSCTGRSAAPTSSASWATSTWPMTCSRRWKRPSKCSTNRYTRARSATSACPMKRPGGP